MYIEIAKEEIVSYYLHNGVRNGKDLTVNYTLFNFINNVGEDNEALSQIEFYSKTSNFLFSDKAVYVKKKAQSWLILAFKRRACLLAATAGDL
ncbi:hypothetical protein BpHYR1_001481 [Brachionus plicatilis]|uniref:Uncharacterized protein n=1 Tax=Brachionus plicatilis TaxID=10195 RepID=A0A3M7QPY0_BRAPC|nr:hypothetical protein BpHYR1_001481 [Brachionus plicatilis]